MGKKAIILIALLTIAGCSENNPMAPIVDPGTKSSVFINEGGGGGSSDPLPASSVFTREDGMIDFAFVYDGDRYHIIGIDGRLVNWQQHHGEDTGFVHATSRDLIHWTEEENIQGLHHPEFAAQNIWAPDIIKVNGVWHMFYTGVVWDEDHPEHNFQRTMKITSTDLYNWSEPIMVLDGESPLTCWGEGQAWDNDCRDPDVFELRDGSYGMVVSIRKADRSSMAIAMATSDDLENWTIVEVFDQTSSWFAESATYLEHNGFEYLFWTPNDGTCQIPQLNGDNYYWRQGGKACEILQKRNGTYWFAYLANNSSIAGFDVKIETMFFDGEEPVFQE